MIAKTILLHILRKSTFCVVIILLYIATDCDDQVGYTETEKKTPYYYEKHWTWFALLVWFFYSFMWVINGMYVYRFIFNFKNLITVTVHASSKHESYDRYHNVTNTYTYKVSHICSKLTAFCDRYQFKIRIFTKFRTFSYDL